MCNLELWAIFKTIEKYEAPFYDTTFRLTFHETKDDLKCSGNQPNIPELMDMRIEANSVCHPISLSHDVKVKIQTCMLLYSV